MRLRALAELTWPSRLWRFYLRRYRVVRITLLECFTCLILAVGSRAVCFTRSDYGLSSLREQQYLTADCGAPDYIETTKGQEVKASGKYAKILSSHSNDKTDVPCKSWLPVFSALPSKQSGKSNYIKQKVCWIRQRSKQKYVD